MQRLNRRCVLVLYKTQTNWRFCPLWKSILLLFLNLTFFRRVVGNPNTEIQVQVRLKVLEISGSPRMEENVKALGLRMSNWRGKWFVSTKLRRPHESLVHNTVTNTVRKGSREETRGSDGITSGDPFLRAGASAEETLEDRGTKIWAHNSGMEDVWRRSQHPPSPSPFPSDTLPNTDWAVCVTSCYCQGSSWRRTSRCFPLNNATK